MARYHGGEYRPTSVSPPGVTLADLLEERGLSQAELGVRIGRPQKTISEIVNGKAGITADTALQLEMALGVPASFWLSREAQFREYRARAEEIDRFAEESAWLKSLPLKDMIRYRWISKAATVSEQVSACLKFFGVASVEAWKQQYARPIAAFRKSLTASCNEAAVSAWLRRGEIDAAQIECRPFERDALISVLNELRSLTCEPHPRSFVPRLRALCSHCGVAVVFVPTPTGCPVSGATRWLTKDKALLQLSLRYRTNDHLWFSFFHEAGHILLHGKRQLFLEFVAMSGDEESEADRFAADLLIPPASLAMLRTQRPSERSIVSFARSIGVAPGIVVGRLQKEGLVDWSHLNKLKLRYQWDANLERGVE
jgi:HTH-type transcriptional regulator/antitoxin HigA